jgi:hypothetical protein
MRFLDKIGPKTAIAAGIIVLAGVYVGGVHASSYEVTDATVTKTWTQYSDGQTIYLIGTNKGVFKDNDSFPYLKFNSSDFYNQVKQGDAYNFEVTGWRIPFMSEWPNIVSYSQA